MPDKRRHRGPHPEDYEAFRPEALERLAAATADLCWLLSRGYAMSSSLKLAGDRFALSARQRLAVRRCACARQSLRARKARSLEPEAAANQPVWLDGLNVLTTAEAALAGGVLLLGRDGCLRDMASIHGHYKRVDETRPAIEAVGRTLARLGAAEAVWFIDRPVSNSGRLGGSLRETSAAHQWNWRVELVANPDAVLAGAREIVATADSAVLERCARWLDLAREVVREHMPLAWVVDFVSPRNRATAR